MEKINFLQEKSYFAPFFCLKRRFRLIKTACFALLNGMFKLLKRVVQAPHSGRLGASGRLFVSAGRSSPPVRLTRAMRRPVLIFRAEGRASPQRQK